MLSFPPTMLKPRPFGKKRGIDVGIFQLFLELIFPNNLPLTLAERNGEETNSL